MKGTLSINRPVVNGDSEGVIEVVLRFGRGKSITIPVPPHDFALALTGKTDVPVELRLRGVSVVDKKLLSPTSEGGLPKVEHLAKVRFDAAINQGKDERDAFYEAVQCLEGALWRLDPVSDARARCLTIGVAQFAPCEPYNEVRIVRSWLTADYGLPEYPVYFTRHNKREYMLTPVGLNHFVHVPTGAEFKAVI